MLRCRLPLNASLLILTLAAVPATAQQSLPTIEVGGVKPHAHRVAAGPRPVGPRPARTASPSSPVEANPSVPGPWMTRGRL